MISFGVAYRRVESRCILIVAGLFLVKQAFGFRAVSHYHRMPITANVTSVAGESNFVKFETSFGSDSASSMSIRDDGPAVSVFALEPGASFNEAFNVHFKDNGFESIFCKFSNGQDLRDPLQQDIDANHLDLSSFAKALDDDISTDHPLLVVDMKINLIDYATSGFASGKREGITKLVLLMMERWQNARFLWGVRQVCNYVPSRIALMHDIIDTEQECISAAHVYVDDWLQTNCGLYDVWKDNADFVSRTALLPLESINETQVNDELSRAGFSIQGPFPHVGSHASHDLFPKVDAADFDPLEVFEKACGHSSESGVFDDQVTMIVSQCENNCISLPAESGQ